MFPLMQVNAVQVQVMLISGVLDCICSKSDKEAAAKGGQTRIL